MTESTPRFRKWHKLLVAALGTTALSLGAVGVAWSADDPTPDPPATADNEANEASEEVDGVDCIDGIDAVTGAECDGGPAANPTDDGPEEGAEAAG